GTLAHPGPRNGCQPSSRRARFGLMHDSPLGRLQLTLYPGAIRLIPLEADPTRLAVSVDPDRPGRPRKNRRRIDGDGMSAFARTEVASTSPVSRNRSSKSIEARITVCFDTMSDSQAAANLLEKNLTFRLTSQIRVITS